MFSRNIKENVVTHSGTPSGGKTTETMLSMSLYFKILSLTVVDVSEGEAFTYKK